MLDRRRARALDHVLLLAVIAGRDAGIALDLADPLCDGLPPGDQRQDVAVDLAELGAERVKAVVRVIGHRTSPYRGQLKVSC